MYGLVNVYYMQNEQNVHNVTYKYVKRFIKNSFKSSFIHQNNFFPFFFFLWVWMHGVGKNSALAKYP